jgi:hypothetical protein
LERYAFKSASAAAARNHIDYLIKNFGVEDVSVNAFAVSVFKSVYNEPFTVETVKYRWSKREEKESASDSQNVLGLILELQKIITDEATLKQIIELLGKPRT